MLWLGFPSTKVSEGLKGFCYGLVSKAPKFSESLKGFCYGLVSLAPKFSVGQVHKTALWQAESTDFSRVL